MSNHHLLLTVDYELFGNGSGDINACLIEPTNNILEVAERYGARVTLFVDAIEFSTMADCKGEVGQKWRKGAAKVKLQIERAVRKGHDVQLHIHPQWIAAQLTCESIWKVDLKRQRIGDMSLEEIRSIVKKGKSFLESIVKPFKPGYQCTVFRAGAWAIQPAAEVLQVLMENEIRLESTVAPGIYNSADKIAYDFRKTPKQPYWFLGDNVCAAAVEPTQLIEVPITTAKLSYSRSLFALLQRKFCKSTEFPCGCEGSYDIGLTKKERVKALVSRLRNINNTMLDFSVCDVETLIDITEKYQQSNIGSGPIPIVAISHNKNFTEHSSHHLGRYLKWCVMEKDIVFSTYPQWLKHASIN